MTPSDGSVVDALLGRAADARKAGDTIAEARLIEQALDAAPRDPRVLNAQGMIALRNGDHARARLSFSAAADADPQELSLWMNLATACRALGDDGAERTAIEHALSINRQDFMAQLRLSELAERRGEAVAAAVGWSAVVQIARGMKQPLHPVVADALIRGQGYLTAHNRAIETALEADVAPRIAAMGSAARRFQACVDHSLGRRRIYANECAGLHYPFLPADEFFDRSLFPWLAAFEARAEAIANEAVAIMGNGSGAIRPYVRMETGSPPTKWSALDGSFDWSACFLWEYGIRNDPVCALCPETMEALEAIPQTNIPGKAPSAFFSLLRPGTHIPPHTGVTNTRAIVHLPLVVPDGCIFRVGGETRPWRMGEALAFDDTIEHEAWNNSDEPRIVLILDVWNPHLTKDEQELLAAFFAASNAASILG